MPTALDLALGVPGLPVAAAVALAASGATLIGDLADRQQARRTGARGHVGPGLRSWAVLALAALVAPTLSFLVAGRIGLSPGVNERFLIALAGAAWLAFAYGILRCAGQRLAWQSGFLFVRRPFCTPRVLALETISQVRLANASYRLFLRDGTNLLVRLGDRGARDLLSAILADVAGRPARRDVVVARAVTGLA